MGAQQHLHVVELAQVVVVDGDESHLTEAVTLPTVVYDITEAVERRALCQFFLSLLDGGGHSKAETTTFVYFYLNHFLSSLKYISSRSWAATNEVFWPAKTVCSASERRLLTSGLL